MEPSFSFVDLMSFSVFCCSRFSNFLSDPIGKQSAMSKREAKKHFPMKVPDGETKTNVSSKDETRQLDFTQARGARGKILRKMWDFRSIRCMSIKKGSHTSSRRLVRTTQNPEVERSSLTIGKC